MLLFTESLHDSYANCPVTSAIIHVHGCYYSAHREVKCLTQEVTEVINDRARILGRSAGLENPHSYIVLSPIWMKDHSRDGVKVS